MRARSSALPHPRRRALTCALLACVVALGAGAACQGASSPGQGRDESEPRDPAPPAPAADGPEFVAAGPGAAHEVVRDAMDEAAADGRRLVVYVGADWCEPCKRFHDAVEAGELDDTFPDLRLLEFDATKDQARLADAGFASRLVPLFCLPDAKGRGTKDRIEGSIKGEGAVANLAPRLQALLASKH